MTRLALVLPMILALAGCQALGQSLGLQPKADAPAYSGIGVVILGSSNDGRVSSKTDQSGAVGASGQASQSAEQSLEIPQETVDALIGAAQSLIAAGNPAAAAGVLDALKSTKHPKAAAPAPKAAPLPAPVPTIEPVKTPQ